MLKSQFWSFLKCKTKNLQHFKLNSCLMVKQAVSRNSQIQTALTFPSRIWPLSPRIVESSVRYLFMLMLPQNMCVLIVIMSLRFNAAVIKKTKNKKKQWNYSMTLVSLNPIIILYQLHCRNFTLKTFRITVTVPFTPSSQLDPTVQAGRQLLY